MVTQQLKPSWTWLWVATGFALLKLGPVHPKSSGDTSSCSWVLRELGLFPTAMIFNHALQSPRALVESSLRLPLETGRRFPVGFWKPALLILLSLFRRCSEARDPGPLPSPQGHLQPLPPSRTVSAYRPFPAWIGFPLV